MNRSMARAAAPILVAVLGAASAANVAAQDYPNKAVRIVVGNAPGGSTDFPARWIAQKLTDAFGKPVVVDFRGGANGALANEFVAKSPGDGYTLLYITSAFVLSAVTGDNLPFDPVKDFSPIALTSSAPTLLVARTTLGISNVKDLVAYAKKNPGKLTFGSNGNGSPQHLYGEMLKTLAGIDMLHVPYKGAGPAMNDMVGDRLDTIFVGMAGAVPLMKSGKIVALGGAAKERSQALPDLPSIHEQGVTGFDGGTRNGISAPGKTPTAVVNKIHDALAKGLAMPDTKKAFGEAGLEPTVSTPAEFDAWIRSQIERYRQVIKAAGIKLES